MILCLAVLTQYERVTGGQTHDDSNTVLALRRVVERGYRFPKISRS